MKWPFCLAVKGDTRRSLESEMKWRWETSRESGERSSVSIKQLLARDFSFPSLKRKRKMDQLELRPRQIRCSQLSWDPALPQDGVVRVQMKNPRRTFMHRRCIFVALNVRVQRTVTNLLSVSLTNALPASAS